MQSNKSSWYAPQQTTGACSQPDKSSPQVHNFPSNLNINFSIILTPMFVSSTEHSFTFSHKISACTILLFHAGNMLHPVLLNLLILIIFMYSNNYEAPHAIFSSLCHFLFLRSKHFPQHPFLKHTQSRTFLSCERSCFTSIQNYRKNYSFLHKIFKFNFKKFFLYDVQKAQMIFTILELYYDAIRQDTTHERTPVHLQLSKLWSVWSSVSMLRHCTLPEFFITNL